MMTTSTSRMPSLVRAWTRLYVRGLPPEIASARRAEVDSDLWEHAREGYSSRAVLGRWLLGIPADLSWRAEAGRQGRREGGATMKESWRMRLILLAALGVALFPVVMHASVIMGNGEFDSGTQRAVWGVLGILSGACMAAGLLLSGGSPRLGLGLVAVGVIGIALLWFWVPMITIPVGLALLWLARQRGRRAARPGDSAAA